MVDPTRYLRLPLIVTFHPLPHSTSTRPRLTNTKLRSTQQFWPTTPSSNSNTALPNLGGGPADQTTPRAANQGNPFEQGQGQPQQQANMPASSHETSSPRLDALSIGSNTSSSSSNYPHSGLRTPTSLNIDQSAYSMHTGPMTPPAGHVGASRPTTGITIGDTMGGMSGIGFGLREPPRMRRAMTGQGGTGQGQGSAQAGAGQAGGKSGLSISTVEVGDDQSEHEQHSGMAATTTANTIHTAGSSSSNDRARAIRGTLTVKLISARNLAVDRAPNATTVSASGRPEPYVVVQFEQNEFVSRPALAGGAEPESPAVSTPAAIGTPSGKSSIPRTNSYGPSLGIASISRAFADAARRTKGGSKTPSATGTGGLTSGQTTPRAGGAPGANGSGAPPMSPGLGGSGYFGGGKNGVGSAGDPVWKEDVSL